TFTCQLGAHETQTVTEEIPYHTTGEDDSDLDQGTTEVITEGEVGTLEQIVRTVIVDGEVESTEVTEETVVEEPVDEVVAVGTREPEPEEPPEDDGGGDGDLGDTGVW